MRFESYTLPGTNHVTAKAVFLNDPEVIQKAQTHAKAKVSFTNIHSPAARQRSDAEIYGAQLIGTLADMAVSTLFRRYLEKHSPQQFTVVRYDDVREDEFQEPDQFDARVYSFDGKEVIAEIEIRSSVCNRIPIARMATYFNVLGWYTTKNKPAEVVRDFYVTVIYHYNQFQNGPQYNPIHTADYLLQGALDLYIVGGATDKLLIEHGEVRFQRGLLQDGATYQTIPILSLIHISEPTRPY